MGLSSLNSGPHKEGLVLLELQAGGDDVVVAVLHGQAAGGGLLVQGREVLAGLRGGIDQVSLGIFDEAAAQTGTQVNVGIGLQGGIAEGAKPAGRKAPWTLPIL